MRQRIASFIIVLSVLALTACPGQKEGFVEGQVSPAGPDIRIIALKDGKPTAETNAGSLDGKFRITLPAGSYEIRVMIPTSPYPLSFPGIVVKSGETTVLAPISFSSSKGSGVLTGKVIASGSATRVTLLEEGIERASINTNSEGKYEFEGLPSGRYTLQVSSPGYANDSITVGVSDDRRTVQDIRQIYITAIEGIDWNGGKIRARGIGLPPKQAPTPTVRRELAKRAALADAERNMLRILEMINVAPGQKLSSIVGGGNLDKKLSGYVQGYRLAVERDMDGGKIEVEIELPLTGAGGLASSLLP